MEKPFGYMSEQDLAEVIERASTLDERLSGHFNPGEGDDAALVDERLEAWCQALAKGDKDRFRRRLEWDGLSLETVRRALGPVRLLEGVRLPEWSELLAEALRRAPAERQEERDPDWPSELDFLNVEEPLAFEEVLAPFVLAAREKLAGHADAFVKLLSDQARIALERGLLRSLVSVSAEPLLAEFEAMRAREQSSWHRLLSLAHDPDARSLYLRFVRGMGEGGLSGLLQEYPVLARLLGTISHLWVEATAEFLGRLQADMPELERVFGEDGELGGVVELRPSLSDPHHGGRSVVAMTFASGRKLIYKPKDLGTEAAYFRLLAWLNEQGAPLPFKVLEVLDRSTHGWVEFAEHLPCRDQDEARRYFERAGMLLCLFYVLEVTDCHYENIIASGEHPVLIDAETLMHHRPIAPIPAEGEDARALANEHLGHSVLRTGLLPRWVLSADERTAYDVSGLGQVDEQGLPDVRVPRWVRVNTDRMSLKQVPVTLPAQTNVPRLDGIPLGLQEHGPQVIDGFRRMYRFLLDRRQALLSGPLRELGHEQVRFVFRATRIYIRLLSDLRSRRYLRDGVDRSIYLEQLGRAQVPPREALPRPEERPVFWPVFASERRAMEQSDIPFFTARADRRALLAPAEGEEIENCFEEPSFDRVRDILQTLDDHDLERQVSLIEGCLYAHLARGSPATSRPLLDEEEGPTETPPSPEAFVEPALVLAREIRTRAIRAGGASATWISPQFLVRVERYQLQAMDYGLYGGTSGVALFLAASEGFAPQEGFGELALAALQPVRAALARWPERFAEDASIGGVAGLGSVAYSLVRVGRFLDEPALLEDARRVANLIIEDRIAADRSLDVIGGAAGAILGLLALHEAAPGGAILNKAIACGDHLLDARTESRAGPRAWATVLGTQNTGFSHGAAGIAYALLRLYEHTRDTRFLEAAVEGIAYEETEYSPEMDNWADYGEKDDEPRYAWQWCRGAPGIGLARLGGLRILDNERVRTDIELALHTTREFGVQGVDHLCCGNLGRAEVLLTAGEILSRPELSEAARANAWRTVARAEQTDGFVLHPMLPKRVDSPGFFQGTAGIGYELLRMAHPGLLPSVLLWE